MNGCLDCLEEIRQYSKYSFAGIRRSLHISSNRAISERISIVKILLVIGWEALSYSENISLCMYLYEKLSKWIWAIHRLIVWLLIPQTPNGLMWEKKSVNHHLVINVAHAYVIYICTYMQISILNGNRTNDTSSWYVY